MKSKLIDLIESHLEENPHQKFALAIADANNLEERNILEGMLKERFPQFTYIIDGHVGAALSCYLGSGLLGVAIQFYQNKKYSGCPEYFILFHNFPF